MRSFFLVICTLVGSSIAQGFVCPENNFKYKGVTCCLDFVDRNTCQNLVDALPLHVQESVKEVQKNYLEGAYNFGGVPNCFWGAAHYAQILEQEEHAFLNPFDLFDALESTMVPTGEMKVGSPLLFYATGKTREEIVENFIPKKIWVPFSSLEHAAVYLGEGLVFQKENQGTDIFSIDSLEHTKAVYEKAFPKGPKNKDVRFEVEAWFYKN